MQQVAAGALSDSSLRAVNTKDGKTENNGPQERDNIINDKRDNIEQETFRKL